MIAACGPGTLPGVARRPHPAITGPAVVPPLGRVMTWRGRGDERGRDDQHGVEAGRAGAWGDCTGSGRGGGRAGRRCDRSGRPRRPAYRRAARAVAGHGDRPPRQPGASQPRRAQGGRSPGVQRVDGDDHDRAVVRAPAPGRPGVGEAARLTGPARDQLPARRAGRALPDRAARLRRAAELPEPVEGPGPRGLLHRVRRDRCDCSDLGGPGAPVRLLARARRGHRAAVLAGRGRRAGRGRVLGGGTRPDGGRARGGRVDRRPQPAVAGPGGAQHRCDPAAGHVRRRGLAGAHREVRPPPRRAVHPARRRGAAPAHRRHVQPGVPAAAPVPARPAPRAASRRRPECRAHSPHRGARRRRPAPGRAQPRRARSRRARRCPVRDRRHAAHGGLRLHGQGLRPGERGTPAEPLVAAHARAAGRARTGRGGVDRGPVGAFPPGVGRRPAVRSRGRAPAAGPGTRGSRPVDPHRHRPDPVGYGHHAGRARSRAARPDPVRARGRRPGRDPLPGRQLVDEPRRVGEQDRGLVGPRAGRLVRRRPRDDPALARAAHRPAPGAGDRRDQPGGAVGGAGRHVEPVGPTAAPDRGPVRPLRRACAGAVVVRDLRRRAVGAGRHPVGGDAGSRGRRPPVDHHPVGGAGAAGVHELRAGVRHRRGVDVARGAGPAGPPGRVVGLFAALDSTGRPDVWPPCPPTRPHASGDAGRWWPAPTPCGGRRGPS